MTMKAIHSLLVVASLCALASCSKKYPLVGTFAGDAHVLIRPDTIASTTESDVKATVVVTTEDKPATAATTP